VEVAAIQTAPAQLPAARSATQLGVGVLLLVIGAVLAGAAAFLFFRAFAPQP
jgi:hypothetical protein